MCHLVLALPFMGLLLFFLLPFPQALALYLPLAVISAALYLAVFAGMRRPVETGREGMIGQKAEVISVGEPRAQAHSIVRCQGELWGAICEERLEAGEKVKVLAFKGMNLLVKPDSGERQSLVR